MSTPTPPSDLVVNILTFDRAEMARRGRLGGIATAARHGGAKATEAARQGFLRRLAERLDPAGILPPEERERLAREARRDHLRRIAAISADRRRQRKGAGHAPA